jgi:hypothetical protein
VVNRRCGAGLAFKTSDRLTFHQVLVAEDVGPNGLNCYASRNEVLIAGEIDLAHGAAAESSFKQVT